MLKLVLERKPGAAGAVTVTIGATWATAEEARVCEVVLSAMGAEAATPGFDCRCARSCNCCSGGCPASRPDPQTGRAPCVTPQA